MTSGKLQHLSPVFKLLLLFILMLVAMLFISLFVAGLGWSLYGEVDFDPELLMADISVLKTLQFLQTVFVFVVPSAIAAYLFFPKALRGLYGNGSVRVNILLTSAIALLVSQYFVGWSGHINSEIVLPDSWAEIGAWILQTEDEAVKLTMKLTESNSGFGFVVNVIILAILPAIGEEWLFRGHVQRQLNCWISNIHVAIFVTSFLFAAMHLQFMTFLPRFFLGVILGYLFYYGGNLWYSIVGHFTNNFLALMFMDANAVETTVTNSIESSPDNFSFLGIIFSLLGVIALLYYVRRKS